MRKAHIDLLRILSIILVMFNHTGTSGYMLFTTRTESPFYFVYMAFSIFCKVAVPIFFMISGALLLHKEESIQEVFKKRFFRIAVDLLIASVVYYLIFHPNESISILGFFKTIYQSSATTALWYLYSYLGLLLMLPMLQKLAKAMTNSEFIYLIGGYIVLVGIIPALELIFFRGSITINPHFSVPLFTTSNIVYLMTGQFLERRLSETYFSKRNMLILNAISIIAIAITCAITQLFINDFGTSQLDEVERYFNILIIIPSITLFFVIKGLFMKIHTSHRVNKIITTIGSSVFGAYLIEKMMRHISQYVYVFLNPVIGSFFASIVWVVVGTSMGLALIIVAKRIPYVNKVVNWLI